MLASFSAFTNTTEVYQLSPLPCPVLHGKGGVGPSYLLGPKLVVTVTLKVWITMEFEDY